MQQGLAAAFLVPVIPLWQTLNSSVREELGTTPSVVRHTPSAIRSEE